VSPRTPVPLTPSPCTRGLTPPRHCFQLLCASKVAALRSSPLSHCSCCPSPLPYPPCSPALGSTTALPSCIYCAAVLTTAFRTSPFRVRLTLNSRYVQKLYPAPTLCLHFPLHHFLHFSPPTSPHHLPFMLRHCLCTSSPYLYSTK
jgi:hypothetical protein